MLFRIFYIPNDINDAKIKWRNSDLKILSQIQMSGKKLELEKIVTISFTTKTTNIASSSVCERKWQFCYFYRGFSTSVKTFLHESLRIIPYSPTILPFFVSCHHNLKTQRFLNVAYCPTGMCTTTVQNRDWKNAISQKGHWYSNLVTLTTDSGESPPKRNSRREGKCGLVKGLS